jgi:hypothetical protein
MPSSAAALIEEIALRETASEVRSMRIIRTVSDHRGESPGRNASRAPMNGPMKAPRCGFVAIFCGGFQIESLFYVRHHWVLRSI